MKGKKFQDFASSISESNPKYINTWPHRVTTTSAKERMGKDDDLINNDKNAYRSEGSSDGRINLVVSDNY